MVEPAVGPSADVGLVWCSASSGGGFGMGGSTWPAEPAPPANGWPSCLVVGSLVLSHWREFTPCNLLLLTCAVNAFHCARALLQVC